MTAPAGGADEATVNVTFEIHPNRTFSLVVRGGVDDLDALEAGVLHPDLVRRLVGEMRAQRGAGAAEQTPVDEKGGE